MCPSARRMTKVELEVRRGLHACLLPVLSRSRNPGEARQNPLLERRHAPRESHRGRHLLHRKESLPWRSAKVLLYAEDLLWAESKGHPGPGLRVNVVLATSARQTTQDRPRMRKNAAMLHAALGKDQAPRFAGIFRHDASGEDHKKATMQMRISSEVTKEIVHHPGSKKPKPRKLQSETEDALELEKGLAGTGVALALARRLYLTLKAKAKARVKVKARTAEEKIKERRRHRKTKERSRHPRERRWTKIDSRTILSSS